MKALMRPSSGTLRALSSLKAFIGFIEFIEFVGFLAFAWFVWFVELIWFMGASWVRSERVRIVVLIAFVGFVEPRIG